MRCPWQGVEKGVITAIPSMTAFNTLRKDGFFPQSCPPLFAGEIREREQAVIYQQPAGRRMRCLLMMSGISSQDPIAVQSGPS
jgi:hypothetical protein